MTLQHAAGQAADLPRRPIPRLAFREHEAADALGIGRTTFLELVAEGRMPRPIRIRPRLPLYDAEDVRRAWDDLKAEFGSIGDKNDFDA